MFPVKADLIGLFDYFLRSFWKYYNGQPRDLAYHFDLKKIYPQLQIGHAHLMLPAPPQKNLNWASYSL